MATHGLINISSINILSTNTTQTVSGDKDFTGELTATTQQSSDNSTKVATTAYVTTAVSNVDALPSQTGQSGKFLTTDGTSAAWSNVDALPSQTSQSGKFLTTNGTTASWSSLASVATSGSYSDLSNTPSLSDLTTSEQQDAIDSGITSTLVSGYNGHLEDTTIHVTSSDKTTWSGKQDAITGAATTITSSDLTASQALISNSSGKVDVSSVTATELGYVSGVTSSIQTQLSNKQATITGAATSIVSSDLTSSKALVSDASGKVDASTVTATELGYLSGVTSAIQTQLDNKVGKNVEITADTKCKITYDAKGLVTAGADLQSSDIPNLSLSKITDVTATADEVNKLAGLSTTATELGYVHGVTSDIQTQLNGKASAATTLAGYGISDAYTKTELDGKISSVYKYKGTVENYASLPSTELTEGDVYNVADTGDNYAWVAAHGETAGFWDKLAGNVDLSAYRTSSEQDTLDALKAPLESPALTGTPTAPTASADTNNTQIATTAFVSTAISNFDPLPSQSGQSGKLLTTNGTTTSWTDAVHITLRNWNAPSPDAES